jgi:hypothetical protein
MLVASAAPLTQSNTPPTRPPSARIVLSSRSHPANGTTMIRQECGHGQEVQEVMQEVMVALSIRRHVVDARRRGRDEPPRHAKLN